VLYAVLGIWTSILVGLVMDWTLLSRRIALLDLSRRTGPWSLLSIRWLAAFAKLVVASVYRIKTLASTLSIYCLCSKLMKTSLLRQTDRSLILVLVNLRDREVFHRKTVITIKTTAHAKMCSHNYRLCGYAIMMNIESMLITWAIIAGAIEFRHIFKFHTVQRVPSNGFIYDARDRPIG